MRVGKGQNGGQFFPFPPLTLANQLRIIHFICIQPYMFKGWTGSDCWETGRKNQSLWLILFTISLCQSSNDHVLEQGHVTFVHYVWDRKWFSNEIMFAHMETEDGCSWTHEFCAGNGVDESRQKDWMRGRPRGSFRVDRLFCSENGWVDELKVNVGVKIIGLGYVPSLRTVEWVTDWWHLISTAAA